MRLFFSAAAALCVLLGILWTVLPGSMFSGWGVAGDEVATYMARRYAALFFGYATILWLARSAEPGPAMTAILAGGAVVTSLIAIVSLVGALTGVVGPVIWSAVVIEVTLAAGFVYYLVRR
jgi:hypothetical protein